MEQRIINALTQAFAQANVELDDLPGGRYSGLIVWEGFTEDDHTERQRRIRQALVKGLGTESNTVGVILAYTPHEMQVMSAA